MEVTVNNINFGKKTVKLQSDITEELIEKLQLNDDSVIIIGKSGKIYTKDENIKEEEITVVEVFSGG
ncbi:MAG: hypothetical protein CSMARM5_0018 [Candidatus Parvarchaeum acidophilus ARMAN-5_'5-way FS']|jgi:sulfur carrier protein ThiS|uniref:ThiamineS protein n=2 Tax=Parvarchaeum acidophilus TaxID=662761 RepID=D6GW28_PARA5|nr:MAG: hypothetical protein BJBARM5_0699 [Candidatus Parvarchaeum acidophilus ARMAN-5]EGD71913.1 MAG: hypothetical protein CSMARM5_0018 [Candidatus Parvarchaeum acidophilus ARMAN-5_'5-way FS']